MTYLNGVHGIIIGGIQNFTADEVVYDRYNNLVHTTEKILKKSNTPIASCGQPTFHPDLDCIVVIQPEDNEGNCK